MKISSWNVNGIRAVERKGALATFLDRYQPDVFLVQEIKAKLPQLTEPLVNHPAFHQFYHSAEKAGYAGTSIWVKKTLTEVPKWSVGMPNYKDNEGRVARVDFGPYAILGVYFPNGGKSSEAWDDKLVFYNRFLDYVNNLRAQGRQVIWAGDVNCAHKEIDIARPNENKNSIGFLPEERAWISKVIATGWVDIFRAQYPATIVYSWWHLLSRARRRNVGWRIDYFFVDQALANTVKSIGYANEQMGSDHCPVIIELNS